MASAELDTVVSDERKPWSPTDERGRNYWRRFRPEDFVTYPRTTAVSYYEEMTLIRRAQQGDLAARNEVWQRNLRLVFSVVNRFYVPRDLMPDAIQEGAIGIQRAIARFDLERYGAFSTYAWPWIWQRIQRFLHYRAFPARIPAHLYGHYLRFRHEMLRAASVEESFDVLERWRASHSRILPRLIGIHRISTATGLHLIPSDDLPFVEDYRFDEPLERESLVAAIASTLSERQRHIVMRRFALDGRPESTLEELGAELGITRERVRQIEFHAIARLRRKLTRFQPANEPDCSDVAEDAAGSKAPTGEDLPVGNGRANASPETVLLALFKTFTFRQANALIHYYGLLGTPPAPLPEVAAMLELSERKTALALKHGRAKLLERLAPFSDPDMMSICDKLCVDDAWHRYLA